MSPQLAAALAELCKMGLQLGGALLIAWLAVRWAVARYKEEKRWERETTALTELLAALDEIDEVNWSWIEDYAREASEPANPISDEERRVRFREAKRRLISTAATASIVLDTSVQTLVTDLVRALNTRGDDYQSDLFVKGDALQAARERLVAFGRWRMGIKE